MFGECYNQPMGMEKLSVEYNPEKIESGGDLNMVEPGLVPFQSIPVVSLDIPEYFFESSIILNICILDIRLSLMTNGTLGIRKIMVCAEFWSLTRKVL